jgi:hypothetical protein
MFFNKLANDKTNKLKITKEHLTVISFLTVFSFVLYSKFEF